MIEHKSGSLKKVPGVYMKIYLLISEHVLEEHRSLGDFSENKISSGCHFSLSPHHSTLNAGHLQDLAWTFSIYLANTNFILLQTCPIQPIPLSKSPYKISSSTSHPVSNHSRDQHHSKDTGALGRGEDSHTHQYTCSSSSQTLELSMQREFPLNQYICSPWQ